jgi:hypothetical protein
MIGELYINDQRVDLNGSIAIPISYSIADVKNPESRKRSRSKTFDLPGTRRNCELFAATFQLTLSPNNTFDSLVNFNPTARTVAKYKRHGLTVFDGLVKLNKVILDKGNYSFNITLYSNIVNIIRDLEDKKLKDLDWSMYNHKLNRDTLEKSWSEEVNVITDGSGDPDNGTMTPNFSGTAETGFPNGPPEGFGYVYPITEYGFERPAQNEFAINTLLPLVYVRECVHKIFDEEFDLAVESDFMDTEQFRKLVIGPAPGKQQNLGEDEIAEREVNAESDVNRSNELNFPSSAPGVGFGGNPFAPAPILTNDYTIYYFYYERNSEEMLLSPNSNVGVTVITDDLSQLDTTTGLITAQRSGDFNLLMQGVVRARMTFDDQTGDNIRYQGQYGTFGSGSFQAIRRIQFRVYVNGVEQNLFGGPLPYFDVDNLVQGELNNDDWVEYTLNKSINLTLDVGDIVEIKYTVQIKTSLRAKFNPFFSNPPVPEPTPTMELDIETTSTMGIVLTAFDSELSDDDPIQLSRFVPDMRCADFLKGIILAFNLYVDDPDMGNNTIAMEPLDDYYQEDVEAIDWTDKVDYSKRFEILPASTIEGKTYAFKFKEDKDYDNERYRSQWGMSYGDREYIVPSTYVDGTKKFQLPFACSVPVRLRTVDDSDVTSIIAPRIIDGNPDVGDIEPFKGAARLYCYNGLVELPDEPTQEYFRLTNVIDPNVGGNYEDFPYYPNINHQNSLTAPTYDLMWASARDYWETFNGVISNNNLWVYHSKFIRELTQSASAIVRCYVRLSEADIYALDFGRLIKINGVLYRLNEIKDWDPNAWQSAQVELLKVLELSNINTG